ncbi:type II RES/Xre toxin-antitoxin system antitoxin [Filimonas effusa]|uniref:DUF2384 domain-containing protein n=1 Tax=Filimonas effusa TaxID=2508721 RepID=A0A4V1MAM8_9BACT|nr:hypothetical protein [Filimonas effusa]RXK86426.1 hypothetical protein ESB13_06365 [Filimonas effusa]
MLKRKRKETQTKDVYLEDKRREMKKGAKYKKNEETPQRQVEEEAALYKAVKKLPVIADFTFKKFAKIAAKVPFTQKDWAGMMHLSERTLQRYAKDNKTFEGIYVDKILHIEELIEAGLATFTNAATFYSWLKRDKQVMGYHLNFDSLSSSRGIQATIDQLGRIQHGIYT